MLHSRTLAMVASVALLLGGGRWYGAGRPRGIHIDSCWNGVLSQSRAAAGPADLDRCKGLGPSCLCSGLSEGDSTDLDGSGTLAGAYVKVKSSTGQAAVATGSMFPDWHRDADQFEQVMGYYWVTTAQAVPPAPRIRLDAAASEPAPDRTAHQPVWRRQLVLPR